MTSEQLDATIVMARAFHTKPSTILLMLTMTADMIPGCLEIAVKKHHEKMICVYQDILRIAQDILREKE